MSKSLKDECEKRIKIVENLIDVKKLKREELKRYLVELQFEGADFLDFVRKVYERDKDEAKFLVALTTTANSLHSFIRILRFILANDIKKTQILALASAKIWLNTCPMLGNLFLDLSEALKDRDERRMKTTIVKLFYYHI